jgi:hypothetical protein
MEEIMRHIDDWEWIIIILIILAILWAPIAINSL